LALLQAYSAEGIVAADQQVSGTHSRRETYLESIPPIAPFINSWFTCRISFSPWSNLAWYAHLGMSARTKIEPKWYSSRDPLGHPVGSPDWDVDHDMPRLLSASPSTISISTWLTTSTQYPHLYPLAISCFLQHPPHPRSRPFDQLARNESFRPIHLAQPLALIRLSTDTSMFLAPPIP
jgi:hypothetical protein